MDVCILAQHSEGLVHRPMKTDPEAFLQAIAPSRPGRVGAVACMGTWSGLADRCAAAGSPVGLGHALSRKALHGGKAKNDQSDAQKMAALLRGGRLPQASVSPAQMRATRDLLRRRRPLAHQRAARLAHVHHTNRPSPLPAIGTKRAATANREGVAKRCAAPAGHTSRAVAVALIPSEDALRRDVARPIVPTAHPPDAHPRYWWHTVPGLGTLLRRVRRDAIHPSDRCPRVQEVGASGRLGTCARASAGPRDGPSGTTIGQAHRTWACAEAAGLCLSDHPAAPPSLARWETKQANGTARTLLAQQ